MLRFWVGLFSILILWVQVEGTRILSFDGGGVRGVVSLEFILKLEEQTGLKSHSDFDIYAGTSTGAMIASMLACGIEAKIVMEGYQHLAKQVFSDKSYFSFFKPEYDHAALKAAFEEFFDHCKIDKKILLKDVPKKLVIPSVNLDDPTVGRWRLQLLENLSPGSGEIPLIEALLESSAAPTYFSSEKDHVDGGIAMNDPSLAALIVAYDPDLGNFRDFSILSIGTGYTKNSIEKNESWGLWDWLFSGSKSSGEEPLISLLMDVQQQIPSQFCSRLLGERFLKINLVLPEATPLDDYSQIPALIADTDQYIEQNPLIWASQGLWVQRNFAKSLH